MGVPQVKCCVCGETVNKRQTVSVGNGRACRHHEGVEEKSQTAQQNLESKHAVGREQKKPVRRELEPLDLRPHCGRCNAVGMRSQEWFMRKLVLGEKYEFTYGRPLNILDPEECSEAYAELQGLKPIFVLNYDPKMKLNRTATEVGRVFGFVGMCYECCQVNGINPMPEVSLEQLTNWAVVAEMIRPEIQATALSEILPKN